jgi:hypothetical protein
MTFYWRFVLLLVLVARPVIAAAPANDNFVNATIITGTNATISATNVDATKEIGEPNHAANPGGRSVWWKWTAPGAGSVVIQTTDSTFDTLLAVYTGNSIMKLNDSVVASNDDTGAANTSLVAFNLQSGTTYDIAVDGFGASSGTFTLLLSYRSALLPDPPPNDSFSNRIQLEGTQITVTGDNYFATKQPNEPNHADELGGASVWWTWTAPVTGNVTIDTKGTDFDTLLAVYRGFALTNLVPVASNDDASTNQATSLVTFAATAGTAYQIAVDGFAGAPGDIQLNLTMPNNLVWLDTPRLTAEGTVLLRITSAVGQQFTLQESSDLVHWQPLATLPNPTGTVDFTDSTGASRRFYRVRQGGP